LIDNLAAEYTVMKILHVYRNAPKEDTKKLVAIVSEGRESDTFNLYDPNPDYDRLVEKVLAADKTICWW
jgi:hypothetical protein